MTFILYFTNSLLVLKLTDYVITDWQFWALCAPSVVGVLLGRNTK